MANLIAIHMPVLDANLQVFEFQYIGAFRWGAFPIGGTH